jgi:quercetin dioxygenase-like cupin family protein
MEAVADRTRHTIGPRLTLTPHEAVTVRRSTPELIEVEVEYAPGGERPPAHLHPAQDETFEVLAGTIAVRVDGEERTYGRGDTFEVPRGAAHQMWNPADEPARAIWQTSPGGRTHQWFLALDAFQRSGRLDGNAMPGPLAMGVLLTHYRDVFRLAARPRVPVRAALAALAVLGRLRGYRPTGLVPGRLPPR